jgi:hypothetical protein
MPEKDFVVTHISLEHQVAWLARWVFDKIFPSNTHKSGIKKCCLTTDQRTALNEFIVSCLPSETLLDAADPQPSHEYLAECHRIVVDGERKHPLGSHTDDEGGLTAGVKVVTCIVYLENTVEQSALLVWDAEPAADTPADHTIDTRPKGGKVCVVVMRGDVWHAPGPLKGHGERCAFVYQAARAAAVTEVA